jgi:outer membrane biosynthesis protein TonB
MILATISPGQTSSAKKKAAPSTGSNRQEPEHIAITSGADAKKIFTYFPYPQAPTGLQSPNVSGMFELTVDPQGSVTEVKILKTIGTIMDPIALQTFSRWKARPGPSRIVDVPFSLYRRFPHPPRETGSHIRPKQ